jgi:hypothetical protein
MSDLLVSTYSSASSGNEEALFGFMSIGFIQTIFKNAKPKIKIRRQIFSTINKRIIETSQHIGSPIKAKPE